MKILTAGFTMLVDFARRNSSTGDSGESGSLSARTAAAPVEDPLIMQSRRDLLGAANLLSTRESSDREPRVRLIHLPKRFTIAIFLPGVLLKNVFVDTTDIGDRIVTVGGCWTDGILSADDVRDDIGCPKGQDSYRGKNSGASVGEARTTTVVATSSLTSSHDSGNSRLLLGSGGSFGGRPSVLQDSLPRGSFEMHYEVPLPYERCHWSSEYEAGVLFLHWDHP
jgi:hypothetical protein